MFKMNGTFLVLHWQIAAGYNVLITTEAVGTGSSSSNKWHAMHTEKMKFLFAGTCIIWINLEVKILEKIKTIRLCKTMLSKKSTNLSMHMRRSLKLKAKATSFPGSLVLPPLGQALRDPGLVWSRASQNLGDYKIKLLMSAMQVL